MIHLKNITKTYQETTILQDVNLTINKGTTTSIIGASGTGKTTLLNIASLLDVPTTGEVYYFNKQPQTLKECTKLRRKHISFVYQQHNLMPEFTLVENITAISNMKGCYDEELTLTLLEKVGLLNHKDKKPSELSGGQKQRASIVRAICAKPDVLFADEPTGNLDPESAEISSNLLINLAKEQNIAVFLITHNHDIAKKCETIYEVKDKNLVMIY